MEKMRVFLAAAFRKDKDQKFLKRIKNIIEKNGNVVWTAKENIGDYYGTLSGSRLKKIIETEKNEIMNSDLVIAILREPVPGPLMQILYASEFHIPLLVYLNIDSDDKSLSLSLSPWLYFHAQIVKSEESLINALKKIMKKIEREYE
jgi:nucleoside 2-deoxyribosyltransferase